MTIYDRQCTYATFLFGSGGVAGSHPGYGCLFSPFFVLFSFIYYYFSMNLRVYRYTDRCEWIKLKKRLSIDILSLGRPEFVFFNDKTCLKNLDNY
jgi:hypothetical protein